eukprot:GHVS01032386.1.p2 GENE.GHVS01032386.1~~GHVS01032386.1.p2  ORF type:complete len:119 (+),score=22.16 GHVS01032386.1:399-755(+)
MLCCYCCCLLYVQVIRVMHYIYKFFLFFSFFGQIRLMQSKAANRLHRRLLQPSVAIEQQQQQDGTTTGPLSVCVYIQQACCVSAPTCVLTRVCVCVLYVHLLLLYICEYILTLLLSLC